MIYSVTQQIDNFQSELPLLAYIHVHVNMMDALLGYGLANQSEAWVSHVHRSKPISINLPPRAEVNAY